MNRSPLPSSALLRPTTGLSSSLQNSGQPHPLTPGNAPQRCPKFGMAAFLVLWLLHYVSNRAPLPSVGKYRLTEESRDERMRTHRVDSKAAKSVARCNFIIHFLPVKRCEKEVTFSEDEPGFSCRCLSSSG